MSKENQQEAPLREGPSVDAVGIPEAAPLETAIPASLKTTKKITKTNNPLKLLKGSISVKPYVDNTAENMGLENYGFAIYPGTYQEEQLAAIERNGVVRYVTGLDEFAPEVQNITSDDKKNAVITNIRFVVKELEQQLATNVIKLDDDEFWSKVTLLKPNNHDFWNKITIRCGNEPLFLKPKDDPYDLIKLMAIEAGGFDLIAKSWEDARSKAKPPKFYLDKEVDTVSTRTEYKKLRNKATSILDKLFGKNPKKLMYIAKILDGSSTQYKNSTPPDTIYDNLDEFIQGNGVEGNKNRAAEHFISSTELDMETLKLKALVRDASFYKFIVNKPDGMIYHAKQSAMLGRNVSDVVEFLKNPLNEDILADLMAQVEKYWNQ
jgi:hypothetical protein